MKILAIETSCDETAMAVLQIKGKKKPSFSILSNTVSSQVKLHARYGGVYPSLAKREHQRNLPLVLKKTLKKANLSLKEIDLMAITTGPGLEPCLWTGVNFAKSLTENKKQKKDSLKSKIPIVPINHIEAHILVNLLPQTRSKRKKEIKNEKIRFPALCLVVSGGHTQMILMNGIGKYKIIGQTRDDAAGECFDKTARILGLSYPGGPAIAAEANKATSNLKFSIKLPRPMINQKNYDFSFSGLKTAVLYDFKKRSPKKRKSKQYIREMCFEIQQSIIDVLIRKTLKVAKDYKVKTIILAGGVAANNELTKQFKSKIKNKKLKVDFLVPRKKFCTDNAVMTAVTAYFNRKKAKSWKKIKVNANLKI